MTFPMTDTSEAGRYRREMRVAADLAARAGAALLRCRQKQVEIDFKRGGEIVTNADRESNDIIISGLAVAFPGDGIFSEESPQAVPASGTRIWIIDPLDSTSNFASGGTEFAVSIGLAVDGAPVLGVVFNPARNEMFTGCVGLGVSLNGIPVRPTVGPLHKMSRLAVSSTEWEKGLGRFARTISMYPMSSMAYKLARVAAGLDDAVLSLKPRKPWGSCAGAALVLAAGGMVTSADGDPLRFPPVASGPFPGLIACSRWKHGEIVKLARALRSTVTPVRSA